MDHRTKVSIRDFLIFQLKLAIDGVKDGFVFLISFVAFGIDLVFKLHGKKRYFPRLMRYSERFDLWLNLHKAVEHLDETDDGLFGASEAGSDTLLGQIEQVVRGGDEPRSKRPELPPRDLKP